MLVLWILLTLFFLRYFLGLTYRSCNSKVCLIGKTAVVTGGSKGIGYQTALDLAARGCKVIIGCRSNAEKQKEDIIRMTHNPNIVIKYLDLASLTSVRKFAKEINETEKKLDILINNGRIYHGDENVFTEDNLHVLMATNYFGHFLLTHLLLGLLKKSSDARIVFLSSLFALLSNLTVENLNKPKITSYWTLTQAYGNTKTAMLMASNIFAEKLAKFGIKSNAIHPGGVTTEIFQPLDTRLGQLFVSFSYIILNLTVETPEEGAALVLRLAVSNTYRNITGTFAWDFKHMPAPRNSKDKEACRRIWEASEKWVQLKDEEKI